MPRQQTKCLYCNELSTLLCDFVLGLPYGGLERGKRVSKIAPMHTCDIPLCRGCAEYAGWVHFNGSKGYGGFDSTDYCREHAGQDGGIRAPVLHEDEAAVLRRAVWAIAQRRAMRERGVVRSQTGQPDQGRLF